MKTILRISVVIVLLCLFVMPVQAQSGRVYEDGSVWSISYIKTKPTHFDDYLKNLNDTWRKYQEQYIEDGKILSYKILSIAWARDDEPNLILMVEYKDWATFDTPEEYWDDVNNKIAGSIDKAMKNALSREEMRTLRGGTGAVELKFKY